MMMYDLEKASKSAHGISLYVSDDPKGSNESGASYVSTCTESVGAE